MFLVKLCYFYRNSQYLKLNIQKIINTSKVTEKRNLGHDTHRHHKILSMVTGDRKVQFVFNNSSIIAKKSKKL